MEALLILHLYLWEDLVWLSANSRWMSSDNTTISPFTEAYFAFFQSSGTWPGSRDCWMVFRKIGAISSARCRNSLVWTMSGSMALMTLSPLSSLMTPLTDTLISAMLGYGLWLRSGMLPRSSSMKTQEYWSFRICALTLLMVSNLPFRAFKGSTLIWSCSLAFMDCQSRFDG